MLSAPEEICLKKSLGTSRTRTASIAATPVERRARIGIPERGVCRGAASGASMHDASSPCRDRPFGCGAERVARPVIFE